MTDFPTMLRNARTPADIFEVVKAAVWRSARLCRGGLMLGLADLGNHPQGWFGEFFQVGSNFIVMNKVPLQRIRETSPHLYKPYVFHVLLHEYIHSLGYLDEERVRRKVCDITRALFGEEHVATKMAEDPTAFIEHLAYPDVSWAPGELSIELVDGFDRSSTAGYIG